MPDGKQISINTQLNDRNIYTDETTGEIVISCKYIIIEQTEKNREDGYIECKIDGNGNAIFSGEPEVIPPNLFSGISELKKVIIPETVTIIGAKAFLNCEGLFKVEIKGNKLNKIGTMAFGKCYSLKEINFVSSINDIGKSAFNECTSLKCVDLSNCKVTVLRKNVFKGCTSLSEVKLPGSLKTIQSFAFEECKGLNNLRLPEGINIEKDAFAKCPYKNELGNVEESNPGVKYRIKDSRVEVPKILSNYVTINDISGNGHPGGNIPEFREEKDEYGNTIIRLDMYGKIIIKIPQEELDRYSSEILHAIDILKTRINAIRPNQNIKE